MLHPAIRCIIIIILALILVSVVNATPLPDLLREEGTILDTSLCEYKRQQYTCYLVTHKGEPYLVVTRNGQPHYVLTVKGDKMIEVWVRGQIKV